MLIKDGRARPQHPSTPQRAGTFRPLGHPVFRALWTASLASNLGTWIHEVGASWLMTELAPSPLWVASVQAAATLPVFLVAVPAGALADIADRRKVLVVSQAWMVATAALLGTVTLAGRASAPALLLLTFCLGLGTAVTAPAWQAMIPEIVPREWLREAITLGSLNINVSRAIGPALGGLLVSWFGPGAAFLFNAVSFLGVVAVLASWRRGPDRASDLPAERFLWALRTGLRYVRYAPGLLAVLVRLVVFAVPASALWALLPLLARERLGVDAGGYGLLLAAMGAGAVAAAFSLARLRDRLGSNRLMMIAATLLAAALVMLALLADAAPAAAVMAVAGAAWITHLSSLQTAAQQVVPGWVRARAMSVYLVCFFGSFAVGSACWGAVAEWLGIPAALAVAAGVLLAGLPVAVRLPLRLERAPDLSPSRHWPATPARVDAEAGDGGSARGPVLVTVEYEVNPGELEAFRAAMNRVRRIRLRDGSLGWSLHVDAEDPRRVVEAFYSESWIDHLRLHERVTVEDLRTLEVARAFHRGVEPPRVRHLLGVGRPQPRGEPDFGR